jgi:pantoate--beta-alanine ligase
MADEIDILRTVAELRSRVKYWRDQGLSVGLIPTMGALHAGHLSLVSKALETVDRVIASVFVNPTQFGPNEDFARYPRQEEMDAKALEGAGCHLLFAPTVAEMYPDGFATTVSVTGVSEGLCGEVRPGHFAGVATVVTKLLLQALPDLAIFGEKDYQQLAVIRRFARDLDIPVTIAGGATVREADGLAMSSRNAYMTPDERAAAPILYKVLCDIASGLRAGKNAADLCREGGARILAAGFSSIDYLEVRDADSLAPPDAKTKSLRILVAARLGKTRLIDNIGV